MGSHSQSAFSTPSSDGTTEASALQAFLVHLEREGLVQSKGARLDAGARLSADKLPNPMAPNLEDAVRKLIAILRKPS